MKIALLGYGKMGKVIERIALSRGHEIVLKIDEYSKDYDISIADVAIDFSVPSAAVKNISLALNNGVAIISGTTGWLEEYKTIESLCTQQKGAFIYASNFSLGVNIFFELNRRLSEMMNRFDQYNVSLEEIHHLKKLDAPSGTAISLAEDIIQNSTFEGWQLDHLKDQDKLVITAKREPEVPGTHTVSYSSEVDQIDIKHTAHNRNGFAFGAVIAAEWIQNKTGIFTMQDVLNLK